MSETVQRLGSRKFLVMMTYLIGCFGVTVQYVASEGQVSWDAAGLASVFGAIAAGCYGFFRENVREKEAAKS